MKVTIPEGTGPHVKLIFAEMRRQALNYDEVAWRSGVLKATLKAWRHRNRPSLENIEAVLSVLGFDLVPVPRDTVPPPDLIAALQPVADKFGLSMPDARTALVQIIAGMPKSGIKRPAVPHSNPSPPDRIAA